PLEHYRRIGRSENRLPRAVLALDLDLRMWRGFADTACPALERLMREGPALERAVAGWCLARWYRDRGETEAAFAAAMTFHHYPDGRRAVPHAGPFLLAIQLALACGAPDTARALLDQAGALFPASADLDLAAI